VAVGANVAMALYSMVLAALAASCLWLGRTYGWRSSAVVVVGCLLAVLADWLIATFWIHGTGYPTIEHVNWIIYFASLAMIGRLPFLVADHA
jgi:predicted membrane protein